MTWDTRCPYAGPKYPASAPGHAGRRPAVRKALGRLTRQRAVSHLRHTGPNSHTVRHSTRSLQHNASECFRNVSNPRFRRSRDRRAWKWRHVGKAPEPKLAVAVAVLCGVTGKQKSLPRSTWVRLGFLALCSISAFAAAN